MGFAREKPLQTFMRAERTNRRSEVGGLAPSRRTAPAHPALAPAVAPSPVTTLRGVRAAVERAMLPAALRRHDWKISATATELHISRATVYKLIVQLGLRKPRRRRSTGKTLAEVCEAAERETMTAALQRHQWNIASAARALGISRMTLYGLMKKFGTYKPTKPHTNKVIWVLS